MLFCINIQPQFIFEYVLELCVFRLDNWRYLRLLYNMVIFSAELVYFVQAPFWISNNLIFCRWSFALTSSILGSIIQLHGVKVAQLEKAWSISTAGRSSSSCAKLTKSFQQAFNPNIAKFFESRPKLEACTTITSFGTLKIHLCLSCIEKVLTLNSAVNLDMLHIVFLQSKLTASEMGGTENRHNSNRFKQHRIAQRSTTTFDYPIIICLQDIIPVIDRYLSHLPDRW